MELRDIENCKSCFWAYPEVYRHIALQNFRRTDIVWQDADVAVHDAIKAEADKEGTSVREVILEYVRQKVKVS